MTPKKSGRIDWQQVRERLARATAATENALHLSPKRAQAVLEERACILSHAPAPALHPAAVLEIITFELANERYAIETRYVREVVPLTERIPLPGAPEFLVGILNLRGEILALIDLLQFGGVDNKSLAAASRVLVLGGERAEFGVVADAVHEVVKLRVDELLPPPEAAVGIDRECLRGVTRESLIVLDGAELFRDGRLFIDQGEDAGG